MMISEEKVKRSFLLLIFIVLIGWQLFAESPSVITRRDYYTSENSAELLLRNFSQYPDSLKITDQAKIIYKYQANSKVGKPKIPLKMLPYGRTVLTCETFCGDSTASYKIDILKLQPAKNEVKIDRKTGGLIVDGLPFFPFGFYTYYPVQSTLAEEEVVKGFNLISPYQKIERKSLKERRKYMDRCADLGMKVHYNLCSLGGGGGVGSSRLKKNDREIEKLLIAEIKEFKDHPALLAWYISDEPALNNVSPQLLKNTYDLIKKYDPYHPVSIVFMNSKKAVKYTHALDIVMADPYPIPTGKVTKVESVIGNLTEKLSPEKPVWVVPQAFGGGEWWKREPTAAEMRVMTYLAILNGAKGVQYFIRYGLSSFPKSFSSWNECASMSLEIAEISPFLLDYDSMIKASTSEKNIKIKAWKKDAEILIIAVNTKNSPLEYRFNLSDKSLNGDMDLIFENRTEQMKKGKVKSFIDAFGTRIYKYSEQNKEKSLVSPANLTLNAGFENYYEPGIPPNCYAKVYQERGATYFLDSRTSYEGKHSLRLTSPSAAGGVLLKFYHFKVKKNTTYTFSIMAKALPDQSVERKNLIELLKNIFHRKEETNTFSVRFGNVKKTFHLTDKWEKYSLTNRIKTNSGSSYKISPRLRMEGKGTAWFDLMQAIPDFELKRDLDLKKRFIKVNLKSSFPNRKIYYTLDDTEPNKNSAVYDKNILIKSTTTLRAKVFNDDDLNHEIKKKFNFHKATGCKVLYKNIYSSKYSGGGKGALVNQKYASKNPHSKNWQGFEASNLDIIIDLERKTEVSEIRLGFLHNIHSWIFLPEFIDIYVSSDGNKFTQIIDYDNEIEQNDTKSFIHRYEFVFPEENIRYIKIVAQNIGKCPQWHKAKGQPAWMFADEIEVN